MSIYGSHVCLYHKLVDDSLDIRPFPSASPLATVAIRRYSFTLSALSQVFHHGFLFQSESTRYE